MSFALALVGVDSGGGGLMTTSLQSHVRLNGILVGTVGSVIAPHGTGSHLVATVTTGSASFSIGGIPAAIAGSSLSCGHSLSGSGHATVPS